MPTKTAVKIRLSDDDLAAFDRAYASEYSNRAAVIRRYMSAVIADPHAVIIALLQMKPEPLPPQNAGGFLLRLEPAQVERFDQAAARAFFKRQRAIALFIAALLHNKAATLERIR